MRGEVWGDSMSDLRPPAHGWRKCILIRGIGFRIIRRIARGGIPPNKREAHRWTKETSGRDECRCEIAGSWIGRMIDRRVY